MIYRQMEGSIFLRRPGGFCAENGARKHLLKLNRIALCKLQRSAHAQQPAQFVARGSWVIGPVLPRVSTLAFSSDIGGWTPSIQGAPLPCADSPSCHQGLSGYGPVRSPRRHPDG